MVTVGAARDAYFAKTGFSTAAYEERWVRVRLFGLPITFPNVASRRRAIRFHDLHHVITGYGTDPRGEAEIGAWELAATFGDRGPRYAAAWMLNTFMVSLGLVTAPRRVYRAFVHGMHCKSVYRFGWSDALLERDIAGLRAELGADQIHEPTWRDRIRFAGLVSMIAAIAALPVALVVAVVLL